MRHRPGLLRVRYAQMEPPTLTTRHLLHLTMSYPTAPYVLRGLTTTNQGHQLPRIGLATFAPQESTYRTRERPLWRTPSRVSVWLVRKALSQRQRDHLHARFVLREHTLAGQELICAWYVLLAPTTQTQRLLLHFTTRFSTAQSAM